MKNYLEHLAASQGKNLNVIWPYDLITQSEIESLGVKPKHEIFSRCKSHLDTADLLIALLDGPQVDDGAVYPWHHVLDSIQDGYYPKQSRSNFIIFTL